MGVPLSTINGHGLHANRPAASALLAGYRWLSTDLNGGTEFLCDGSTWIQCALGVTEAPSGGGSGVPVSDPITLSSAELLDLHNTPIALLPAPTGDGQSLWLIGYSTLYTPGPGPVAYTAGADAEIDFVVGDELVANFAPGAAGMTDTVPYRLRQPLAVQGRQNPQVNQPLTLSAFASDGAALLNGDGTLTIRVVAAFV